MVSICDTFALACYLFIVGKQTLTSVLMIYDLFMSESKLNIGCSLKNAQTHFNVSLKKIVIYTKICFIS